MLRMVQWTSIDGTLWHSVNPLDNHALFICTLCFLESIKYCLGMTLKVTEMISHTLKTHSSP